MLFPQTSIGDLQFRLLLIRPSLTQEGGRTIDVTHQFDTIIGEGRTTIEERRAGRAALLLTQKCTLPLIGGAADDWRKGLADLGARPVAMPLWIDALPVANWSQRIYDAEQVLNFNPVTGDFAIYAKDDIPETPTHPLLAPLLLGRWKERPAASVRTSQFAEVEITLKEASPWSCRIGVNSYGSSWGATPNWSSPLKDASDYGLELIEVGGAVREPGVDRSNATARWRQEAGFVFTDRLAIRQALSWFVAKRGSWASWSPVPAWFQPGTATTATPDSYTARFASDMLAFSYVSGAVARSTVGFVQEVSTPSRDQALASETYLYKFTYQHDSGNPELYTNWDQPLVGAEGTFEPEQCAHKEMLLSLRPQDVKADLSIVRRDGTLMADWIIARLFGKVNVTIWKCDPENVEDSREEIFDGLVRNVLPDGNKLQVTATLFGKMLEKRIPSDVFSSKCNAYVFDSRCGLDEATYRSSGTSASTDLSSDGMTLTVHTVTGFGGTSYAANWFGPNGILRTGTGRNTQVVTILSSVMSGGNLVVKLNRPIFASMIAGGGQTVQLVPGCGQQYETDCGDKYDNKANFRGFPFMPDYIEQNSPNMPTKVKK